VVVNSDKIALRKVSALIDHYNSLPQGVENKTTLTYGIESDKILLSKVDDVISILESLPRGTENKLPVHTR